MTDASQPSYNPFPPPPQSRTRSRTWRRPVFVAAAGCAALVGLGSVAVAASENDSPTNQNVVASTSSSNENSAEDCSFEATLTMGGQSSSAANAFGPVDRVETHRGINISVNQDADHVAVGAMVEDTVFLELRGEERRESELVDLMKSTIDRDDDFDHDHHDTVVQFSGDHCDPATAFDDDAWVEDFFRSDTVVDVESDDGECRFSSLFADGNKGADFSFDDLDWSDFDLDLDLGDDGFDISLDTGDGTVSLTCVASD